MKRESLERANELIRKLDVAEKEFEVLRKLREFGPENYKVEIIVRQTDKENGLRYPASVRQRCPLPGSINKEELVEASWEDLQQWMTAVKKELEEL